MGLRDMKKKFENKMVVRQFLESPVGGFLHFVVNCKVDQFVWGCVGRPIYMNIRSTNMLVQDSIWEYISESLRR
jgi:hypothetical protein